MSLADEILFGNKENILAHLAQLQDINEPDEYGLTYLIEAIIANKIDIGQLLLERGADPNEPDLTGSTPLHWAVENNSVPFCKLLLEHKADPNAYNSANQPVLVKALLRDQHIIKKLLYEHGADLNFAQDYINTKLLGHRFELEDQVDIVNANGKFIELEFAGFFLEFTLGIIYYSVKNFLNNFAARRFREYFYLLKSLLDALATANQLIHYQQFLHGIDQYNNQIYSFLKNDPLIIPICYEGHAICFVKYRNYLAKCDRGANSKKEGAVVVYEIQNPNAFRPEIIKSLIYERQDRRIIHEEINRLLNLKRIGELPVRSQIIGNCSWANVEAAIPTLFFLMMIHEQKITDPSLCLNTALEFYETWQNWDKDVALNECIQSFWLSNPARKASKAALLAAVLVQTCKSDNETDIARAKKILQILTISEYSYVLKSYLKVYKTKYRTSLGNNLLNLMREADLHIPDFVGA